MNRFIRQLPGKVKQSREWLNQAQRWPLILTASIVWGIAVWQIYRTEFLAGFWGITNDEIAVVTIERDGSNSSDTSTETIIIQDPSKSFWDGLQLLGVPLVLAILGAWFQKSQQEQAEQTAKEQQKQADDKAREEVLQVYFDRISALLIDKNLIAISAKSTPESLLNENLTVLEAKKVRTSEEQALLDTALDIIQNRAARNREHKLRSPDQQDLLKAALTVIRARTLSILRQFEHDIERKSSVIRFLAEAEIISNLKLKLNSANLRGADLHGVNFSKTYLNGAKLNGANLFFANFSKAKLRGTHFNGANLIEARLNGADLFFAKLNRAKLNRAKLNGANLQQAELSGVNLSGANLNGANLFFADLSGAQLNEADLSKAILIFANLSGADLFFADLSGAQLNEANLSRAILTFADLANITFDDKTIWPSKEEVAKAQNIPIKLQKQLGLTPEPPQKTPTAQQSLKPPQ